MKPLKDVLKEIAEEICFTDADSSEPDWIACHVLGCGRASLRLIRDVEDGKYREMLALAKERATGKPLSQVLGYTEFLGLRICVNVDVLCPRQETELLAEQGIIYLKSKKRARALDLCTGSGCIAVALSKFSDADVTASDVSQSAICVAKGNAERNGVKINFVLSDAFDGVEGIYDLIVSNPPYIPTADIETLDSEVKDYEPRLALDGGEDGLDFYRIIAKNAASRLSDGGMLLLECGKGQSEEIINMLSGFDCDVIFDLAGIDRIIKAVKKSV